MKIGVDLGGTSIKVGAIDGNGKVLVKNTRYTLVNRGKDFIIKDIIEQIEEILYKTSTSTEKQEAIGIGVPGLVETSTGNIRYAPNLFWKNVPIGNILKDYFKRPIFVHNDASIAALAERLTGTTQGMKNSAFITLGTGVGSGFIINDSVYSGTHGWGAEMGHMVVGENFYDCNCGQNGCLETFISATGLIKYVQKLIKEGEIDTLILKKVQGDMKKIQVKDIFEFAKGGDVVASKVQDRFIKYLSIAIVNIMNILDPQRIVIGGGLSKSGEDWLELLTAEVSKRVFNKEISYGDIVLSKLGNDAGIIGAACLKNYMHI